MTRTVAVTGGSSGIGLAAARLFAGQGDRVYCLSRHAPEDEGLRFIETDVTSDESVAAAFGRIKQECGSLDVLVSNAGMGISGAIEYTSSEDARRQLEVNVLGFHSCVRYAVPLMRERGGAIIATSSVAAVFAIPFQGFYSASKFALNALVLALANELAPFNIRVAAVMPGDVRTGFTAARVKAAESGAYGDTVSKSVAVMENDEKNGMTPERIAAKIFRLASARHPKVLSTVGLKYKFFCFLGKALPIGIQNPLVGALYIKK